MAAPDSDTDGQWTGATYVFRHDGQSWQEQMKLVASDAQPLDHFGSAVSVWEGTAIIGAYGVDVQGVRAGAAYIVDGLTGADCNDNGIADACDIIAGESEDADGDGVPDECQSPGCPADLDGSGDVGFGDLLTVLSLWGEKGSAADIDQSGIVDFSDLLIVLAAWGPCL